MVPLVTAPAPLSLFGGVLAVVGLLALGRFFLALGGLDPASAFGGMGSSREMTIAAIAEPAMMLAIFTVAITRRFDQPQPDGAGARRARPGSCSTRRTSLAFAALFIVLLAETGRIPVDNPATHLELTMIHEAMLLEYSGRYLALMEWGASIKQLVLMTLLVEHLLPGRHRDGHGAARRWGCRCCWLRGQAAGAGRRGGAGRDHQRQAAPVPRAGPVERGLHSRHAGAALHVPVPVIMNPPTSTELGSQLITLLAARDAGDPTAAGRAADVAHQHPALRAAIADAGRPSPAIVAYFHNATHVYVVAVLTLIGKVIFLPWLLNRLVRRIQIDQEIEPLLNSPASMLLCGGLTLLGYIVARPFTSLERLGNNTLGIAITLLLTGFFLMFNRRKAITQVLALLTVENGVMLAAVALTTYGMPLVVELGIFFDVMVAVMVLGILVYRIRETFASMDVSKLNQLKG